MGASGRSDVSDSWVDGAAYEHFMGRWSRQVARRFVRWLQCPPGLRWLDVGSGTGALTAAILATAAPASVLGLEPSAGFVDEARRSIVDERVRFEVGAAADAPPGV